MEIEKIPLSQEEQYHLDTFTGTRKDWTVITLYKRLIDEDDGSRSHKYGCTHPYITGMLHVIKAVKPLLPAKILDIGSPLTQNVALAAIPGAEVTVIDIRPNEDAAKLDLTWVKGTATDIPYPDSSWSIITSLWVMCHVGDGRYGDDLVVEGDRLMLREIARILKPGGLAIIGPGIIDARPGNIYNLHRIYSWDWLKREFDAAGFDVEKTYDLEVENDIYIDHENKGVYRRRGFYGLAMLRKR